MTERLPAVYLSRHGSTASTAKGQHTKGLQFTKVFTSPSQRAAETRELTGFGFVAEIDRDLVGYKGLRVDEILANRPDWQLFCDGCRGGELTAQVAGLICSGHFIRVWAAPSLSLGEGFAGKYFLLNTACLRNP